MKHHNERGEWPKADERLVKRTCQACGVYIEFSLERYERRGNFCEDCDKKATLGTKEEKARRVEVEKLKLSAKRGRRI